MALSPLLHYLLEHFPGSRLSVSGTEVERLRLTFRLLETAPGGSPPPASAGSVLGADVEGWPRPLVLDPTAGNRPEPGQTWECTVDAQGRVFPILPIHPSAEDLAGRFKS